LFYAELDNSQANNGQQTSRAVVIGQITSAGVAVPNVPIISQGPSDAITQGGPGSILALMTAAYRKADPFGELWYLPLSDNGSGVKANGSIAYTAAPTQNGTHNLYIAGVNLQVAISSTMTAANVATAVVAAVAANTNLPVTAAIDGTNTYQVDFIAKNAGLTGNDIDIRTNYIGAASGEVDPAGLAYTITAMANGATNPVLTTALANLDAQAYDFLVCSLTDVTSMQAITAYLNDSTGAWSWEQQFYGHAWYARKGTFGSLVSFGTALNDQHSSVLGYYNSPTPSWVVAADFAGTAAPALRADPARPLHTLAMSSLQPPPLVSRFPATERNSLLFDGISTFTVTDSGQCLLEGTITTYQLNKFNQPDDSYLQINTLYNLESILQQLKSAVTSKFARVKLAADGTKFADGASIVTPSTIKSELIAQYMTMEYNGQTQNSDEFIAGLIVQQNATYPNRADVLFDPALIDQLDILALLCQFRLT
jgi:phage tail sheath gpL-like